MFVGWTHLSQRYAWFSDAEHVSHPPCHLVLAGTLLGRKDGILFLFVGDGDTPSESWTWLGSGILTSCCVMLPV